MVKLLELLLNEGPIEYPENHKPGIRVNKGGSMCGNCEYHEKQENLCNNKYWLKWHNGDAKIPYPADEYCCNWWHSK